MNTLIKCHIIFAELFDKCSNGKKVLALPDRMAQKYCSVLLLSQEHEVEPVIPKYDGKSSWKVAKFHTEMHTAYKGL